MIGKPIRSSFELRELEPDSEISDVVFEYNEMIKRINTLFKSLSIQSNFDCQIIDVSIPAATEQRIYHRLGIPPKFRLILRQEGNGLLTDIPLQWNDNFVTIRNNGAVTVNATIALIKE